MDIEREINSIKKELSGFQLRYFDELDKTNKAIAQLQLDLGRLVTAVNTNRETVINKIRLVQFTADRLDKEEIPRLKKDINVILDELLENAEKEEAAKKKKWWFWA